MIEVKDLTKAYGRIKAINNLSFAVEKGEILGFLGPNGAGKSTTMNIITGYIPATEGIVKVAGYDVLEDAREVKKKIGYLPENPPVYPDMTVEEYLLFVSQLKSVSPKMRKSNISEVMELVKIQDVRKRLIKNLSKGYKQRVGLAQAMIGNPEVLILDEPTVGLDPKQIIEIRNLIKSLGKDRTIILSSHILPEVSAICQRVIIINKGEIVAIDTPEKLSNVLEGSNKLLVKIEGYSDKALEIIKGVQGVKNAEVYGQKDENSTEFIVESESSEDIRKLLFYAMADNRMPILEIKSHGLSLEEVFLQLTTSENSKEVTTSDNSKEVTTSENSKEEGA